MIQTAYIPSLGERRLRRRLATAGLPRPCRVRQIGRVLRPLLALQREPGLTLNVAATRGDFPSRQAFERCWIRLAKTRLSVARRAWGWEHVLLEAGLR